jgi:hypothetical protein
VDRYPHARARRKLLQFNSGVKPVNKRQPRFAASFRGLKTTFELVYYPGKVYLLHRKKEFSAAADLNRAG